MSDETTQFIVGDAALDAIGDEPKRRFFRRKKKPATKLTHCENCSSQLHGPYCADCGQHAIDYRRSLWALLVDAADSFLNWDTKFLQTTQILLTRPWRLTNDFNAGRRVRYANPLRLYLLASIAFFLLAKLVQFSPVNDRRATEITPEDRTAIEQALTKLAAPDSQVPPTSRARLEAVRARWLARDVPETPEQRIALDRSMRRLVRFAARERFRTQDAVKFDVALSRIEAIAKGIDAPAPPDTGDPAAPGAEPRPYGPPLPPKAKPANPYAPVIEFDDGDGGPKSPFATWLEARVKEKIGEDGTKVQLFLETLRNNIPTMMLCCIPLFALVLKILYIRQRRYYIEHLVYALHIHSFVYVAVIMITLLSMALERSLPEAQQLLIVVLALTVVAQVFISIRRVYQQGWFMSIFKFLFGGIVYLWVLAIALAATAVATLLLP